ncbi:MAG TPA: DUF1003 domain-containing protein [Azospirillaceae bacterium]|nr:DUF1003 domain-containing protein [Azospirillaceae bacterium]
MADQVRFLAQHLLHAGLSPLNERDRRIIARIARRMHVARNLNQAFDERSTLSQRLADRVAEVGGSWGFILGFCGFLVGWAVLNAVVLGAGAFDPYPFVFLNLLLSMVAAIQAPIIMMSQNRQAAKDRLAAALDYEVNLKSETELANLHDKVDRLENQLAEMITLQRALLVRGDARPDTRPDSRPDSRSESRGDGAGPRLVA